MTKTLSFLLVRSLRQRMNIENKNYMRKFIPDIDDITQTAGYKEAIDDIKHGRVTSASSVDDLFKQVLGENWRDV